MVECPERSRISREIANAIREESRLRRGGGTDRLKAFHAFRAARERVKRLREEYRLHVAEHGCLPSEGSKLAADAAN